MGKNNGKIILGNEVLMDLTADTVEARNLLRGQTAHNRAGDPIVGTCDYDADTSDATASAAELLDGSTAYAGGRKITGTRPNRGAVHLELSDRDTPVAIPMGDHDGSGTVGLSAQDKAALVAENLREGIDVLGVHGTMSGAEAVKAETVTMESSLQDQTRLPGPGYTHIAQVTVKGITVTRTENPAGGLTVKIG